MFRLVITLKLGRDQEHMWAGWGRQHGLWMAVRVTVYHVVMDFGMMRAGRVLRALPATGQQRLLRREGERKERI